MSHILLNVQLLGHQQQAVNYQHITQTLQQIHHLILQQNQQLETRIPNSGKIQNPLRNCQMSAGSDQFQGL